MLINLSYSQMGLGEVREAYAAYRSAWDIAKHHRDELVPLRQRIAEENVLRYNDMFIGVFDLLADARAQIAGVNASIEALRDFWLARAELDMALLGPTRLTPMAGRRCRGGRGRWRTLKDPRMVSPLSGSGGPRQVLARL